MRREPVEVDVVHKCVVSLDVVDGEPVSYTFDGFRLENNRTCTRHLELNTRLRLKRFMQLRIDLAIS